MTRDDLIAALANVNLSAFLRVIRQGETSQDDETAYRELFGGGSFESFADHPRQVIKAGGLKSSAAGAYQILAGTWDGLVKQYGFTDFSPASQDQAAVALIAGRSALQDAMEGRLDEAIRKCAKEWASLPGSPYGQPRISLQTCHEVYASFGGTSAPPADGPATPPDSSPTTPQGKPMGPFLIPFLEAAASLIPAIAKLGFGSGSEVAQRNVAAGAMVADAVMGAVKAGSHEEALQAIQTDANSLQAAKDAANTVMAELGEAGGGGIEGARNAAQFSDGDWRKVIYTGPFILAVAVLPLIYAVVLAALLKFEWLAEITSEVRTGVITSVTGLILGSLMGYFYGTSASSARKDNLNK